MKVPVLVIGSGAGGASTAATLARAGVDVLVLEEGPRVDTPPTAFSFQQMKTQYRNKGQLVALGLPPINYAEGRCVGGSTEINSGLYHRPSESLVDHWVEDWQIRELTIESLLPLCDAIEENLQVSLFPQALPPASQLLKDGAERLGWHVTEVPRWFKYDSDYDGVRQSMSRTYLVDAEKSGAVIQSDSWVKRLILDRGRAISAEVVRDDGSLQIIDFDAVFVCGGAVQSAALMQRSGITRNVGKTLSMHPTVKAVARTREDVTNPQDVPVTQIREFSPFLTIGGSATNLPLLGLSLMRTEYDLRQLADAQLRMPIYYAAIRTPARGRVRSIPGMRDPLVTFRLSNTDMQRLRQAMGRMLEVLLAADVDAVIPSVLGGTPISSSEDVPAEVAKMSRRGSDVMTVHICSSVPMGEDRSKCAVNSFGRSFEASNVIVNDAAILPEAPGINPQGTVMALAIRNTERFLLDNGETPPDRRLS